MGPVIYNVPIGLIAAYREHLFIARTHDPSELVPTLAPSDLEHLVYVQVLSPDGETDDLLRWREPVPLDLVMAAPATDFPLLYRYAPLLDHRPVRITVPAVPGCSKAVKLALSLQFPVKLEIAQPDPALIEELAVSLDLYLHRPTVTQPVEYFHSSLLAFLHQRPVTLWTIQEEDPAGFRYVTEQGEETLAGRFAGTRIAGDAGSFIDRLQAELMDADSECASCPYFQYCGGYFKWPRREYRCEGVKRLFELVQSAGAELQGDLAVLVESEREGTP